MAGERDKPTRLGRLGLPESKVFRVSLGCVVAAAVIAFALRGEFNQTAQAPVTAGGSDTITPTAIMQPSLPRAQPVSMAMPVPQTPSAAGPVMPANNTLVPPTGDKPQGPRRVTSFAAKAQQQGAGADPARPPATSSGPLPGMGTTGQPEMTQVAFAAQKMPGLRAGQAIDTTFLMQPGLYRITLAAPINSERGGTFFGILPEAIRSPAGVVLMERGSRVWGAYKNEVGPGQERVVSVAAWGLTPYGVPVPLGDSVAADGSGRAGMPGTINTHFWARFGGAITLMVTQGAFQAATAALQSSLSSGSGNSYLNLNSSSLDQAVASAMRNNINIQSTVDVPAGTEISFMLNQPIDFTDAYRLAPTGAR